MRRRQALKILRDNSDRPKGTLERALVHFGVKTLCRGHRNRIVGQRHDGSFFDLVDGFDVKLVVCCDVSRFVGYPETFACSKCKRVYFMVPKEKDLRGDVQVVRFNVSAGRIPYVMSKLAKFPRKTKSRGGEVRG